MADARARFVTDQGGLARALTGPQGAATTLAMRMARQTTNAAKMKAPVDSGILRNSIAADPAPRVTGLRVETKVEASANYATPVHEGVKGGKIITPRQSGMALTYRGGGIKAGDARALKFQIGGRTVFARSVVQGKQKARPFLLNGAKQAGARLGFDVRGVP